MDYIGRRFEVTSLCAPGNAPDEYDIYYVGLVLNRIVKIVHCFDDGLLLTDYFVPELMEYKNDYCHYGFIVLTAGNLSYINE